MFRRISAATIILNLGALAAPVAAAGSAPAGQDGPRISAERAVALAVNDLTELAAGYRVSHPDRTVDFTPDGVRVDGLLGAPVWTWTLERVASSTGRVLVEVGPTAPVSVGEGLIRYDRCVVQEEYRLEAGWVEQQFVIPEPLPLDGADLVVVGRVACAGELTERGDGWSWRNARGEVTLGGVTVLDADGERIPARFDVSETSTRLVVDGDALSAASYPVIVDPRIGNNRIISDMGPDGDPSYDAWTAAVAYNNLDNQYLVVWWGNDDVGGLAHYEYEIFGQLLLANGTETGFNDACISYAGGTGTTAAKAWHPAVAFNSTRNEYLVVWSADNPDSGCVDEEFEIWGQVLDPDLNPIYSNNFRISSMGGSGDPDFDADDPAVAYNPDLDQYLVVWEGDSNTGGLVDGEHEVFAQRVGYNGALVGANLRVSDMGGTGDLLYDAFSPDVVYNGHNHEYLIVWFGDDNVGGLVDGEYEVFGQLLLSTGGSTGPNDSRLSDVGGIGSASYGVRDPAVAYNSVVNEYLVVWRGDDNVGGLVVGEVEVFGQRLDYNLYPVGANDLRLSDVGGIGSAAYNVSYGPGVAYNPLVNEYLVVWSGEDSEGGMVDGEEEIFAQLLTWDVQQLGPNDELISATCFIGENFCFASRPVVAANTWNGQFLVAWHADPDSDDNWGATEIFTQRMDGMALFVDAFESGDTTGWSSVVP